jgi:hypothetical protein
MIGLKMAMSPEWIADLNQDVPIQAVGSTGNPPDVTMGGSTEMKKALTVAVIVR